METSTIFETKWAFKCGCCDEIFDAGTLAFYNDKHVLCNGEPDHTSAFNQQEPDAKGREPSYNLPDVMPRGKTATDRCDRCFQIPSSSGACGC